MEWEKGLGECYAQVMRGEDVEENLQEAERLYAEFMEEKGEISELREDVSEIDACMEKIRVKAGALGIGAEGSSEE